MGPYCMFCLRRCFVPRVIPGGPEIGKSLILATCREGMMHDLAETGHTRLTALNPALEADKVEALRAYLKGDVA